MMHDNRLANSIREDATDFLSKVMYLYLV